MIRKEYLNNGVRYSVFHKNTNVLFPLKLSEWNDNESESDWTEMLLLEQLWNEGFLIEDAQGYLIKTDNLFDLEPLERKTLGLPQGQVGISLSEKGNVTTASYQIRYRYLHKGNLISGLKRHGNILCKEGKEFWLNQAQWRLISYIDDGPASHNPADRGKYFARIKRLAKGAEAKIDSSIENRNFLFIENVSVDMEAESDHEIQLFPSFDDIDKKLIPEINENLEDVVVLKDGRTDYRVFFDEERLAQSRKIRALPVIKNEQVPAFMENPYAYLPEDIDIDEATFSERVKGLKILTGRAVPFVEGGESKQDWFQINAGIRIDLANEEQSGFISFEEEELFRQQIEHAINDNQSYIYFEGKWIKVSAGILEFIAAKRKMDEYMEEGKTSGKNIRKILDIFDNIDCVEYNETLITTRKNILNPLMQYMVPSAFHGKLDDYQVEGYNFLRLQKDAQMGSLLADDMGLGKTAQVIALLAFLMENHELQPLLVVVPLAIIENWVQELQKFLPDLDLIYIHRGPGRLKDYRAIERYNVTIVGYETLARDQVTFGRIKWSYIICDETQKIKNFNTLASNAVKGMNAEHKIAMTGTPIENNLSELWSIVDFIQPGLLGSHKYFVREYEKPLKQAYDAALANELIEKIKPIFIRRTKADVLSAVLPEKEEITIPVEMSELQRDMYMDILNQVHTGEMDNGMKLASIQKLIQICSHPRLLEQGAAISSKCLLNECPKLYRTIMLLKEISNSGEKVLIFTRFRYMQAILRKVIFDIFQVDAQIVNGENSATRFDVINSFQAKEGFNVLILSPKAAGVGLNITKANHVIHYTREWNPAVENQATDRVFRRGQEKPVHVYYPIVTDSAFMTVEEKLSNLLEEKKKLMENIIVVNGLDVQSELMNLL